jgi:hypothetical protein
MHFAKSVHTYKKMQSNQNKNAICFIKSYSKLIYKNLVISYMFPRRLQRTQSPVLNRLFFKYVILTRCHKLSLDYLVSSKTFNYVIPHINLTFKLSTFTFVLFNQPYLYKIT